MTIIREAAWTDYLDLYELNRDGLGYDYPPEKTQEKLRVILSMPMDRLFVAEADGKVVGYVHASAYECTYSDSLKNIMALVVEKNYRKHGVGRQLMESVEQWAKQTGSIGVRLVSGFSREEAHRFYFACGYHLRKEQKNFVKIFEEETV